jgi:hypothetical protein
VIAAHAIALSSLGATASCAASRIAVRGHKRIKGADETLFLNLSGAVNVLLEDDRAIGTMVNDDSADIAGSSRKRQAGV